MKETSNIRTYLRWFDRRVEGGRAAITAFLAAIQRRAAASEAHLLPGTGQATPAEGGSLQKELALPFENPRRLTPDLLPGFARSRYRIHSVRHGKSH